jgi:hypothetical protein
VANLDPAVQPIFATAAKRKNQGHEHALHHLAVRAGFALGWRVLTEGGASGWAVGLASVLLRCFGHLSRKPGDCVFFSNHGKLLPFSSARTTGQPAVYK